MDSGLDTIVISSTYMGPEVTVNVLGVDRVIEPGQFHFIQTFDPALYLMQNKTYEEHEQALAKIKNYEGLCDFAMITQEELNNIPVECVIEISGGPEFSELNLDVAEELAIKSAPLAKLRHDEDLSTDMLAYQKRFRRAIKISDHDFLGDFDRGIRDFLLAHSELIEHDEVHASYCALKHFQKSTHFEKSAGAVVYAMHAIGKDNINAHLTKLYELTEIVFSAEHVGELTYLGEASQHLLNLGGLYSRNVYNLKDFIFSND